MSRSRLDELIDELEQRLGELTPDEQRDFAELLGRAGRCAGITAAEGSLALAELAFALGRHLAPGSRPRPDQQCQSPESRPPWFVRTACRWECLALPPRFGEGFCASGLQIARDLPI